MSQVRQINWVSDNYVPLYKDRTGEYKLSGIISCEALNNSPKI